MPLSLVVKKAIRDTTDDLNANLARINAATGKTFTFDVDWEKNVEEIEGIDKESVPSVYQRDVLEAVARCVEKTVEDPLLKEAFLDATTNNKITIKINDKAETYWVYTFPNGDLVLEHRKSIANVSDVAYVDLVKYLPVKSGSLPLAVKKNIAENKENEKTYLEEIATATGTGPWAVQADFNTIVPKVEESSRERIADIYFREVLQNVAYLLKNKLTNELIKSAFNEATTKKTITYEVNDKIEGYWALSIKDDGLLIQHKSSIANTGDVSYYKLETIIPIAGVIDLVAKLDLQDYKSKGEEALESISKAAGTTFTFDENSLEGFYKVADESERQRIGALVYGEILPNLAYNLQTALQDDMIKEGFLEAATEKKIAIKGDPKQSEYWSFKFENGVFVLSAKMPVCNVGDVSYFQLEKIL